MGSEKNYQIKFPSKQLKTKNFSTLFFQTKLNPWFVTGLIDAEGSFSISINKINDYKLGWRVRARFAIGLNICDLNLLLQLQEYFGGIGSISQYKKREEVNYSVSGIKDLTTIIIPHFKN